MLFNYVFSTNFCLNFFIWQKFFPCRLAPDNCCERVKFLALTHFWGQKWRNRNRKKELNNCLNRDRRIRIKKEKIRWKNIEREKRVYWVVNENRKNKYLNIIGKEKEAEERNSIIEKTTILCLSPNMTSGFVFWQSFK